MNEGPWYSRHKCSESTRTDWRLITTQPSPKTLQSLRKTHSHASQDEIHAQPADAR